MILTAAIAGVGLLGSAYYSPHVRRYTSARTLGSKAARTRSLVLTYDDGPGKKSTEKLLSMLNAGHAKATFFLLGQRAEAFPEIVDRLVADGHEVGCHTYAHTHAWKAAPWTVHRDITRGYQALSRWMPKDGSFRPPYGKINLVTALALWRRGARAQWWTIDSGDTRVTLPSITGVIQQVEQWGGGVVLMHDCDRGSERSEFVLNLTKTLLETARRERLTVRTLGDLCSSEL